MKKSIVLMLLGAAVLAPETEATVTFSDDVNTKALWHMDSIGTWYGVRSTSDDTSVRGDPIHTSLLRVSPDGESGVVASTPGFFATSPYGGNWLQFDGIDDDAHAYNTWTGDKSSLELDFGMAVLGWPALEGDKMGLIQTWDWRLNLVKTGGLTYLEMNVLNTAQTGWTTVTSANHVPAAVTWFDIHTEYDGANVSVTMDGVTTSTPIVGGISQTDSLLVMGRDLNASANYFNGRIDEVRIASIPEPATMGLLGLAGAIIFGARRMRV